MTVAHSTLTGSSLHENKGVSSASDNTVATASGGQTVWQKLTINHLASNVLTFSNNFAQFSDQKTNGTSGGVCSNATWNTRTLNTTNTNNISGVSLAANQITLPSGTYYVEANAPAAQVGYNILRIRNVTDSSDILMGTIAAAPNNFGSTAYIKGRFTIASSKIISLQHYTEGNAGGSSEALGKAAAVGATEVYANLCIWKL